MQRICYLITLLCCSVMAQHWQPLGSGLSLSTRCLYSDSINNLLYVGGHFAYAGGYRVNGIATWNGSVWDSLGGGDINCYENCGPIVSIINYQNEIYVGGYFWNMGGANNKFLAKWYNNSWHNINVNNGVLKLFAFNNKLYAFGGFDTIAGIYAHRMAVYDGIYWSPMGNFNWNGVINSAIEYNGKMYGAGNFTVNDSLKEIAVWENNDWHHVGHGVRGDAWIEKMIVFNGELYIGGIFTKQDGNAGNYIMRWDGTSWHDVGGGVIGEGGYNGQIHDMVIFNNELYVVGVFSYAGGIPAQYIAKWNGQEWCSLGSSFDNTLMNLAVYNNELIIGGGFRTIDGDSLSYIAKWSGGNYVDTCGIYNSISEKNIQASEITIYPNPATNSLLVQGEKICEIQIFNIIGQKVKYLLNNNQNKYQIEININDLKNGIYLLTVITTNGNYYQKIIKE